MKIQKKCNPFLKKNCKSIPVQSMLTLLICLSLNLFSIAQGKLTIKNSDALEQGNGLTLIQLSNGMNVQLLGIGVPMEIDTLFLDKEHLFIKLNHQKKDYLIQLDSFKFNEVTDYTVSLIRLKHNRFNPCYNLIILNENTGASRPFLAERVKRGS